MNEGIALFDATGRPITMNRRIIELVGRSGSSRKLPIRRFVEPVPEIDPMLLPFESEKGELMERAVVRHRTTDERVIEVSMSRQPDGGIVLLARDVTALDRQEAEAVKAQRLDGIMRMTHQVSHEVGNMIGIITGSLGLLEREAGFNDRQNRHIARIRKAADRGRSLASSMLTIGSQQPIHQAQSMSPTCCAAWPIFSRSRSAPNAGSRSISMTVFPQSRSTRHFSSNPSSTSASMRRQPCLMAV